ANASGSFCDQPEASARLFLAERVPRLRFGLVLKPLPGTPFGDIGYVPLPSDEGRFPREAAVAASEGTDGLWETNQDDGMPIDLRREWRVGPRRPGPGFPLRPRIQGREGQDRPPAGAVASRRFRSRAANWQRAARKR